MTRDDTISIMIDKANELLANWTREGEKAIWEMCLDWNSKNEDAEIFMCEYQSDCSDHVNGFMIEDDYWVFDK